MEALSVHWGARVQEAQGDFVESLTLLGHHGPKLISGERSTPWRVSPFIFLMSIDSGPGLPALELSPPTAFPLRRVFGQRQMRRSSCRCNLVMEWKVKKDPGKKPVPKFLGSSPSQGQMPAKHNGAPSREESATYNCLTSPFPSFVTASFRTGWTHVSGLLNSRWTIQAENEFISNFYCRMRERKKKKGGEPDCWQCSLVAKSVFNSFPHSVESRQIA